MVVIAIIAILMALTAGAIMQVLGSQKKTASETIIQSIASALQQQVTATVHDAKQETYPPELLSLANGNDRRARVLWIKLRLKIEFPTRFEEAWDPSWPLGYANSPVPLPPKNEYQRALQRIGWVSGTPLRPSESSACLFLALTQGRRGQSAAFNPQDSLPPNAIADTR